jgi:hypothetical protein
MGTSLSTGAKTTGPPSAKLPDIGNSLTFAVIDVDNDVPVYRFGTNPPVLNTKADGTPKKQIRITALVVAADGAQVGSGDNERPAEPGDVVSIYVGSYAKWDPDEDKLDKPFKSWSAATDEVGLEVGFVGQWRYVENLPSNGAEPRKNRKFKLRADKPEEAAQQARCEELRRELQREAGDRTALAAAAPVDGPTYTEEDF